MYKKIPGWDNYMISPEGKVINKWGTELHPTACSGYPKVTLRQNRKAKNCLVHRLVAETFIPNPEKLPYVNHIDGDKLNCRVENLEWCTPQLNTQHAIDTGLIKRGPRTSDVAVVAGKIDLSAERMAKGLTQQELAEKVGVIRQTISHIETGRILPSVPTAMAIAKVLELNWADFFTP